MRLSSVQAVNDELKAAINEILGRHEDGVQAIYFALIDQRGDGRFEPLFGVLLRPDFTGDAAQLVEYAASRIGAVAGMPESVLAIRLEEGEQLHQMLAKIGETFAA